jgi:hypothetical protein
MTSSSRPLSAPQAQPHDAAEAHLARPRRLDVRLSPTEYGRVVGDATRRGMSVSGYVRQTLVGQIDHARDRDAHLLAMLARTLDARAEALAEMVGEVALTLVERLAPGPTSPEDRHTYVAGAVECFRDALDRHLNEERR